MDSALHQLPGGGIDLPMAGDGAQAGKCFRNDMYLKMPAIISASVTGVEVRIVFDTERQRIQRSQFLAEQLNGFGVHAGRAFLKGLMTTFS